MDGAVLQCYCLSYCSAHDPLCPCCLVLAVLCAVVAKVKLSVAKAFSPRYVAFTIALSKSTTIHKRKQQTSQTAVVQRLGSACSVLFLYNSLIYDWCIVLFSPAASACSLCSNRGPRRPVSETAETQSYSNQQLLQQQQATLAQQDEKLDGILDGVTKLKVMSQDINQELDLHAHLLTELDSAVDQTDGRIQRNTKRITNIEQAEGSGCCFMIIVILLAVLIVLLLAAPNWFCKILPKSHC